MMDNRPEEDILWQAAQVVDDHTAELERDDAKSLIEGAFGALPWELQEDYREVQDLYRQGKLHEANFAWDLWMEKAREMGLL